MRAPGERVCAREKVRALAWDCERLAGAWRFLTSYRLFLRRRSHPKSPQEPVLLRGGGRGALEPLLPARGQRQALGDTAAHSRPACSATAPPSATGGSRDRGAFVLRLSWDPETEGSALTWVAGTQLPCRLPGCTGTGSRSQEPELGIEPTHFDVGRGHPHQCLNC